MSEGLVSLVGAGPGDPGLLTVKGMQRLREAEVVLYDRLGVGPRAIEQRDESVMEQVGESRERRVAVLSHASPRVFGEVQWQRPVGSEDSEKPQVEARYVRARSGAEVGDRGQHGLKVGLLPEANRFVAATLRMPDARRVAVRALDVAQRSEEADTRGLVLEAPRYR